jgi:hypothetical protein
MRKFACGEGSNPKDLVFSIKPELMQIYRRPHQQLQKLLAMQPGRLEAYAEYTSQCVLQRILFAIGNLCLVQDSTYVTFLGFGPILDRHGEMEWSFAAPTTSSHLPCLLFKPVGLLNSCISSDIACKSDAVKVKLLQAPAYYEG